MAGCHLVVAEGDGEPPIVPIDDLNAVVSRAAEVIIRIIPFTIIITVRYVAVYLSGGGCNGSDVPDVHHIGAAGNNLPHLI